LFKFSQLDPKILGADELSQISTTSNPFSKKVCRENFAILSKKSRVNGIDPNLPQKVHHITFSNKNSSSIEKFFLLFQI